MDIKTIAVLFDNDPSRETRMDYATNLARRHGAHLVGIFLLPPDIGGGWLPPMSAGKRRSLTFCTINKPAGTT
ncbi:hypothetical protein EZH22_27950 [Xanthobacter dioxanivorans]|uniref:Uncharacterized protein n=1 Tax=Xanthobacter dioxanivorans TaxID=2528964 RepID=A0A974PN86_9HYPH|nr:hypothetical protein [Xanthobacter dioxanivorans]QRG06692.1 hypothetical protein EZH22_27950 [Xanthobacter dioxanivorans]